MRILHADPDQYYLEQFKKSSHPELDWFCTDNPQQIFPLLKNRRPELMIMELFFADVQGFDLLKEIRSKDQYHHLPVIIFSHLEHLEDIQEAMSLGATGYFVKGKNPVHEVQKLVLSLNKN